MDTLFSMYRLSGTRLARLIVAPPERRASLLWEWYAADAQEQRASYFDHYGMTRAGVRGFHRRDCSEEELRAAAESWRLRGLEPEHQVLRDNARAVVQYLDEHCERELVVLGQRKLEAYVGGLRVTTEPHICALDGPQLCWIWLHCPEVLDVEFAHAKANVTLLLASIMGIRAAARIEVVHAATRRIISCESVPAGFGDAAVAACELVRSTWMELDRLRASTLASRNEQG